MQSDFEKVRTICAEALRLPLEQLNENTRLSEDLHLTSIDVVEMAMMLEDQFKVALKEENLRKAKTLAELTTLVTETVLAKV
jgi:acyl carrier protein